MVKREIRTRPVDVYRKMPVMRAVDEDSSPSDETLDRSNSLPSAATFERQTSTLTSKPKSEIPTPIVEEVADYETNVEANFKLPVLYIRAKKTTGPFLQQQGDESVDYNLEGEDEEWLKKHRLFGSKAELEGVLSADLMEKIIDELEKAQGASMELMSGLTAETALAQSRLNLQAVGSNRQIVQEVYQFWVAKRQRYKKPLLRRFWPVTSINDTNPHQVFRPREKERYKLRKHRKNDMDSFRKMQTLKRDLDKVLHLMEMVKRRERLKLNHMLLHEERFLQLLAEMMGQPRKPTIPRETPEIKFKIRLKVGPQVPGAASSSSSMEGGGYGEGAGGGGATHHYRTSGTSRRERLKRDREAEEADRRAIAQQPESNPEQDRLKSAVGMGYKEKEQALPTPDYLPSFMEELSLRRDPYKEEDRRLQPYGTTPWASYGWRGARGGRGRGSRVGYCRAGVVTVPRCVPSEFSAPFNPSTAAATNNKKIEGEDVDEEEGGEAFVVKYRCRGRIGRGGRLVIDRLPMAPIYEDLNNRGLDYGDDDEYEEEDEYWSRRRRRRRRQVLLSSGSDIKYLDKYPTTELDNNHDVFKYPIRFPEIADATGGDADGEEEVVEPACLMLPHAWLRPPPAKVAASSEEGGPTPMEVDGENDLMQAAAGQVEEGQGEDGSKSGYWGEDEDDPVVSALETPFGLDPLTCLPGRPLPHPSESVVVFKFQIRV